MWLALLAGWLHLCTVALPKQMPMAVPPEVSECSWFL